MEKLQDVGKFFFVSNVYEDRPAKSFIQCNIRDITAPQKELRDEPWGQLILESAAGGTL